MELTKVLNNKENKLFSSNIINTSKNIINENVKNYMLIDNFNRDNVFKTMETKLKVKCIMNQKNLLYDLDYDAYSCEACDKIDTICKYCFDTCHKNHNTRNKNSANVKTVSLKNNPCICAMKNHEFKNSNNVRGNPIGNSNQTDCPLNDIFSDLQPDFYFYERERKEYFCFYCAENCMYKTVEEKQILDNVKIQNSGTNNIDFIKIDKLNNDNESSKKNKLISNEKKITLDDLMKESKLANLVTFDKLEKVPSTKINRNIPNCCCKNTENHNPFYENNNCLSLLFKVKELRPYMNIAKLPAVIFDDKHCNKFLGPLISKIKSVFDDEPKNNIIDDQPDDDNFYEDKQFKSSIDLLENISECYTKSFNPYLNYEEKFSIFSYFTFDYLIKVFQNTNYSPQVMLFKADMLKFFRNLTLKPIIKFKNMAYIDDLTNTSVLHRLILGRNFPLENTLKEKFYNLAKLINTTLNKCAEKLKEDESFIYLFAEYIKLLNMLLPFNDIFLDNNILKNDIDAFSLKAKVSNNNNRDFKGLNELFSTQEYDFDYRINKFFDHIPNYIGTVKTTGNGFKSFLNNWEKIHTKIMVLKNDYVFFRRVFLNDDNFDMKYSFQESKFNENIFKLLFSFSMESTNDLKNIRNDKFYDLVLNKNDYYLNKIKNYTESSFNFLNDEILNIIENSFTHPSINHSNNYIKKFIEFTSNSLDEEKINIVENSIKEIELTLNEYFSNKTKANEFCSKLKIVLENLVNYVKKNILNQSVLDQNLNISGDLKDKIKLIFFKNQICLFKLNLFHNLIYTWVCLYKNLYLREYTNLQDPKLSIFKLIVKLLDLLTYENPFLSELFFNPFIIKLLLSERRFYIDRLRTLKKYNYKIDFEFYTIELIKHFEIKDNWYEDLENVNLTLKNFAYILKYNSEKTLMVSSSIIYKQLNKILESQEYTLFLNELKDFLMGKSEEVKAKGGKDQAINFDFDYPLKFIVIRYLLKCINFLASEYFYFLIDKLNTDIISKIINIDHTLDPTFRRACTDIYYRYYCKSYFNLKIDLDQNDLQELKENIDFNLFTKVNINKVNLNNNDILSQSPIYIENNGIKIKEDIHPKNILRPLIHNMEIFRLMFVFHESKFKNKMKKIIKYFENFVLKPVIYGSYKIIYFAKNISAELKFVIYQLIYLFLQCFHYFLDLIKENDLNNIQNIVLLDNILYLNCENNSSINNLVNEISEKLKEDISKIDEESFDKLKLNLLLEIFGKHLENFIFYRKLLNMDQIDEKTEKNKIEELEKYKEIIKKRKNNDIGFNANIGNENGESFNKIFLKNNFDFSRIEALNSSNNLKENLLIENSRENLIHSLNEKNSSNPKNGNINIFTFDSFTELKSKINSLINHYESCKKDFNKDNVLKKIFCEEIDDDLIHVHYREIIAYDLYDKIDTNFDNPPIPINAKNNLIFESINKLFKVDPSNWQYIILKKIQQSKKLICNIIEKQLPILLQYVLIEFNKLDTKINIFHYDTFLNLIEFFRLLCENHHKFFQTLLINFEINELNKDFFHFNFILKIPTITLEYLKYYLQKTDLIKYFKSTKSDYFEMIVDKLTDYNIELIQGCLPRNFDEISKMKEFSEYYESHYKLFDFFEDNELYDNNLANFIKFLNCFIEENSNKLENKVELIKLLNPKKLYTGLINCFIELFRFLEDIPETNPPLQIKNYDKVLKDKFLDSYLINKYNLSDQPYFNISFGIFKYFKRVSLYHHEGEKVLKVLDNFKKTNPAIFELFNLIVKDVEIVFKLENSIDKEYLESFCELYEKQNLKNIYDELESSDNEDTYILDKVIFLIHNKSIFQTNKDISNFIDIAPIDDFNTKLNFLLDHYTVINEVIEVRKRLKTLNNRMLNYLYNVDYNKLEKISAFISFISCLLMLFTLHYNEKMKLIFPGKIYVYSILILHNLFLAFFIISWLGFNIFRNWINKKADLSILEFTQDCSLLIFNEEIFILLWNFIFGVLALLNQKLNFLIALQLFSIFKIFPTMSSVIFAVQMRYKQFASTGFLLMILILFYTSITYYFFRNDLYIEDIKENICESYLQCFLSLINTGIRSGSGIEFGIKGISERGYFKEFLYGWMFYFIIMLIIVNIINGIIVDTFQALREQNNKKFDILTNFCYICSKQRSDFEIKALNFEKHIKLDHNIKNYFDYFIKIKDTDEHELNSLDSQVLDSIKLNKTDFFPKTAKCFEHEKKN